ncbi:MAG: hypothetical protein PHN31_01810 [Candidatus Gracilibacteria bacterium]|nr:hypothetical protein [Candidatus Gracilibacteria bacterium]
MKILLFIPTMGNIPTAMTTFLMKLNSQYKIEVMTTTRTLIHAARNLAIEKMIEGNFDYLVMLDDDNIPCYDNFVDVLIGNKVDVVSSIIRLRNRKEDLNICFDHKIDGLTAYINYQNLDGIDTLEEIGNCGSGLVCLSRKVCYEMKKSYPRPFENKLTYYIQKITGEYIEFSPKVFSEADFKTNSKGGLNIKFRELSEDYLFFERVKYLGYKVYADTRITCSHIGPTELIKV